MKELEEYDAANKFTNEIQNFESDLYQNLELWDNLMRVFQIHKRKKIKKFLFLVNIFSSNFKEHRRNAILRRKLRR